jgi:hypothetical protein
VGGAGRQGKRRKGPKVSCSPTGSSINWNAGTRICWQPISGVLQPDVRACNDATGQTAASDSCDHPAAAGKAAQPPLQQQLHLQSESTIGNTGFRLGATRKTLATDASVSRISRLALFRRHLSILRLLGVHATGAPRAETVRYYDAKRHDQAYVAARHAFLEAVRPLGPWLVNDVSLQQWTCAADHSPAPSHR